jgi:hypothetical protein
MSAAGKVTVVLQRIRTGHKSHNRCVAGAAKKRRSRCTYYSSVFTSRQTVIAGGRVTFALPTKLHGKRLPLGSYRLVITTTDASGHPGAVATYPLVLTRA